MSELKAYRIPTRSGNVCHCYFKSEADKVIAEKDKELRHHKFKRCLAMAMWCCDRWVDIATPYVKSVWYRKWQLRWLELADKFKVEK